MHDIITINKRYVKMNMEFSTEFFRHFLISTPFKDTCKYIPDLQSAAHVLTSKVSRESFLSSFSGRGGNCRQCLAEYREARSAFCSARID